MTDRVIELIALVGSLREASINRRLAQLAAEKAPEGVHVTVVDTLGTLPFYSEDDDPSTAADAELNSGVAQLRGVVGGAGGVLIVTPEYNGTIPAALKNAIDWLSRGRTGPALSRASRSASSVPLWAATPARGHARTPASPSASPAGSSRMSSSASRPRRSVTPASRTRLWWSSSSPP